jgi:hypothetical protein
VSSDARTWAVLALTLGLGLWGAGCEATTTSAQPALPRIPAEQARTAEWRQSRHELAELRLRYRPRQPYKMNLGLELTEPRTGQRIRARGAVAVAPARQALRMIMLGPGGTTALDLWLCRDRFRFVLPAVELTKRGDRSTSRAELRGMPVDFLRWWMLRPLAGQLLCAASSRAGGHFVLRDRDAVVDVLSPKRGGLWVERRSGPEREQVVTDGPGCGTVRYRQASMGIDILVRCEKLDLDGAPPAAAFADPDDPADGCLDEDVGP